MIKQPNLRVINRAISAIEGGAQGYFSWSRQRSKYSCLAIEEAVDHIHKKVPVMKRNEHGMVTYPRGVLIQEYKTQYQQFVKAQNGGKLPRWWNDLSYGRHWRISALKAFKQACIDAAKKTRKGK